VVVLPPYPWGRPKREKAIQREASQIFSMTKPFSGALTRSFPDPAFTKTQFGRGVAPACAVATTRGAGLVDENL